MRGRAGADAPLRLLAACGLGALALWAAGRLWPVLWPLCWPFAAGALGASAVEPAVRWLGARGVRRALAAPLCLAAVSLGAFALGAWVLLAAGRQLWRLSRRLPALYGAASALLDTLGQRAGRASRGLPPGLRLYLAHEVTRAYREGLPLIERLAAGLQHGVRAVPDALFALFIAFAGAYFLARDREALGAWLRRHLGPEAAGEVARLAAVLRDSVWGLVRAQLLLAGVTFAVSLAGLTLMGAPYGVLASLVAALLDLLPVVGPAALFVPWAVGCALGGLGGAAVGLGLLLVAVVLARTLLTPHLLGRQVGLHPFVALGAMYVGSRLAGLPGLVLGPVLVAAARGLLSAGVPSGRS